MLYNFHYYNLAQIIFPPLISVTQTKLHMNWQSFFKWKLMVTFDQNIYYWTIHTYATPRLHV